MNWAMKKSVGTRVGMSAALLGVLAGTAMQARAQSTVDARITVDNSYVLATGDQFGVQTVVGFAGNTSAGQIFNCPTGPENYSFQLGAQDYIYLIAWSDDAALQGALGQFGVGNNPKVYTGTTGWEVYATGQDLDTNSPTAGTIPSITVLNNHIVTANAGSGAVATTSQRWVNTAGGVGGPGVGQLYFGEPNTSGGNFSPLSCLDVGATWMWYNATPGTITNPTAQNPPGSSGHREFLIFRRKGDTIPGVTFRCTPPPNQMTLWLPMDNIVGASMDNIAGAGGGPGTMVGTNSVALGEYVTNARRFDGSAGNRIDVPSYPGIQIGTNDFTIDMWVKLDGRVSSVQTLIDKRAGATGYSFYLFDTGLATGPVMGLQLADGSGFTNWNAPATSQVPADGQWHHLAVSIVRNGNATFYLDGVNVGTVNVTARAGSLSNAASLLVGGTNLGARGFKGWIDEVEVFCRALSGQEVEAIAGARTAGKCKVRIDAPWDMIICQNQASFTTNLTVQNLTGSAQQFQFYANPGYYGGVNCSGPSPTAFNFPSGSLAIVPNGWSTLPLTVTRDPAMLVNQTACYQVYGVQQPLGWLTTAGRGQFGRSTNWCITGPVDLNTLGVGQAALLDFSVTNTSATTQNLVFRVFAMATDEVASGGVPLGLNGLPPGEPILGTRSVAPGATTVISVSANLISRTTEAMPADIILAIDRDGDGIASESEALRSSRIFEAVGFGSNFSCDSIDFNNDGGFFDPNDIDAFLSIFSEGPCIPSTATCNDIDFNNDGGQFDPCDISSFLQVFAEGPCSACGD